MQQRVVIAMALAVENASLIILDEPTTGLDATVEAEVLDLIEALRARAFATSVLFIGHNLGVIARMCGRVGVLYAGQPRRGGTDRRQVFANPLPSLHGGVAALPARSGASANRQDEPARHDPGLSAAASRRCGGGLHLRIRAARFAEDDLPDERAAARSGSGASRSSLLPFHIEERDRRRGRARTRCRPDRALPRKPDVLPPGAARVATKLGKTFGTAAAPVHALFRDISLDAGRPGETLGLVGESGSGKTTLARVAARPDLPPDPGSASSQLEGAGRWQPIAGSRSSSRSEETCRSSSRTRIRH